MAEPTTTTALIGRSFVQGVVFMAGALSVATVFLYFTLESSALERRVIQYSSNALVASAPAIKEAVEQGLRDGLHGCTMNSRIATRDADYYASDQPDESGSEDGEATSDLITSLLEAYKKVVIDMLSFDVSCSGNATIPG